MVKRFCYFIVLSTICFIASSFSPKFKPTFAIKTVVIDAGHGGKDPGCHGSKYKEKDVALAVALKLGKFIEENIKDVKVVYTRKTDVFVELQERAMIANRAKADLFICVHCNSACVRDKVKKKDYCRDEVHGAETYVMGIKNEKGKLDVAKRENSAILLEDDYVKKYDGFDPNSDESYIIMSMFNDTYLNQSLDFASKAQKQFARKAGREDKGVKRASLWVLWRTYMPAVLTEIGYLTNPAEEQFLGSSKGQDYIASGLFRAFREYKDGMEGSVKKYDDAFEKQEAYKLSKEDSIEIENNKKQNQKEEKNPSSEGNNPSVEGKSSNTEGNSPNMEGKSSSEEGKSSNIEGKSSSVEGKSSNMEGKSPNMEGKSPNTEGNKDKSSENVVYKVQLMSSDKRIPFDSDRFKGVEKPGEYVEKGIYKYTAGEFANKKDAVKLQSDLRKIGFKDAFVIAMQGDKRIPLK